VVLACPGLVPFVVAALDKLAELCACLSVLPCQVVSWQGSRRSVRAYAVRAIALIATRAVYACTLAHNELRLAHAACGPVGRVLPPRGYMHVDMPDQVTLHTHHLHARQLSCPAGHIAGGPPGVPATGCGEASGDEGSPYADRAFDAEQAVVGALRGVAQLGGASRALALALARAGALGAAMRLAERCARVHLAPRTGEEAGVAFSLVRVVLRAMRPHLTEVRVRRMLCCQLC
jgi:hypothetical protein